MRRSDWQTKFTAHAHHQPHEHQGGVTGVDGEFRSALEHQGSSQEDDAIFSSAEHERSPPGEIPAREDLSEPERPRYTT